MIALELFYQRFDSKLLIRNDKSNATLPTSSTSRVSMMAHDNEVNAVVRAGLHLKSSSL